MISLSLGSGAKWMCSLVAAGWLAHALAAPNRDIEMGIAAYQEKNYEAALAAYQAAQDNLGERAEIHYNRGLVLLAQGETDNARTAFEHGTESDVVNVRASAHYELGNLDFDQENWEGAISHYISALKEKPEHRSAKWNLELALLRKKQKEEEQKKNEEQKQDEQQKQDENQQEEQKQDEQEQKEQKQDGDPEQQDEQNQEDQKQEQNGKNEQGKQEEQQGEKEQASQEKPKEDSQNGQNQEREQPQTQPVQIEQADVDKSLEQLDEEDQFYFGRPYGQNAPVKKDW